MLKQFLQLSGVREVDRDQQRFIKRSAGIAYPDGIYPYNLERV